jgi:hypothetical protein
MVVTENQARLTVDLGDPALYRAIRHAAIDQGRPVKEIVAEALRIWLEHLENQEDLADLRAVKGEPTVSWEQVKAEIDAAEAAGVG